MASNPTSSNIPDPVHPVGYVETSYKMDGTPATYINVGDNGWQVCDGSVVQTPELAKVLEESGSPFGTHAASGLPLVPDMRGRLADLPSFAGQRWWVDGTDPNYTPHPFDK